MGRLSIDILKKLFNRVQTLYLYLIDSDLNLTNCDPDFVNFLNVHVVAQNTTLSVPSVGGCSQDFDDDFMRLIQSLTGKGEENVLTSGMRSGKEKGGGLTHSESGMAAPVLSKNPGMNSFKRSHWQTLHQIVGDKFFRFLLMNSSLFKHSKNGLIQILGTPVNNMLKNLKLKDVFLPPDSSGRKRQREKLAENDGSDELTKEESKKRKVCETASSKPTGYKPTRRGRKKKKLNVSAIGEETEPFYAQLPIENSVYLHAKNLRETVSPQYHLNWCTGDELYNSIIKINVSRSKNSETKETVPETPMKKVDSWLQACQNPRKPPIRDGAPAPERMSELVDLFDALIKKHRKLTKKSSHLLNVHCPVPSIDEIKELTTAQLLDLYSPVGRVFRFIRRSLCFVVPVQLVGSTRNLNEILDFLYSLLKLPRGEKASLGLLMTRIKTQNVNWTRNLTFTEREKLFSKIMMWIMRYCFMLVKSFFYVTLSSGWKNQLLFYRKRLWRQLNERGINSILTKGVFVHVTKSEVQKWIEEEKTFGFSPLRLVPKTQSLRPIAHLGWRPRAGTMSTQSVNEVLSVPFRVLHDLCTNHPECLGYGQLRMEEFYDKYAGFVAKNRGQPLFFVKADIQDCYDSINIKKLIHILESLFQNAGKTYKCKRYVRIGRRRQRIAPRYRKQVSDNSTPSCKQKVSNHDKSVLLEQEKQRRTVNVAEVMSTIRTHLLFNVVRAQGHFYRQIQGISQGSVMSSLLCNIYCGAFEREVMEINENDLLVRQVDDYLYLTNDQSSAKKLLKILTENTHNFNLRINPLKTRVNFDCMDLPAEARPITTQSSQIQWCGLVIDLKDFSVGPDYRRYDGLNLDYCINTEYINHPGFTVERKLLHSIRIKMYRVYYDARFHSERSIITNLRDVSVFAVLVYKSLCGKLTKFHRHIQNDEFLVKLLLKIPRRMRDILSELATNAAYPNDDELEFIFFSAAAMVLPTSFNQTVSRRISRFKENARLKISEERLSRIEFTRSDINDSPLAKILS